MSGISSYLIKIENSANPNMGNNKPPCVGSMGPAMSTDCTHTLAHENLCRYQKDIVWTVQQRTNEQPTACKYVQQTSQYAQ
jgi:hypothetical protein